MSAAIGTRIVRGAAWSAVESWGRHAFMFAILVVLARQLGAEAFGLAALAMVAPIILAVPVTNGVPEALVQRPQLDAIHLDSAFWLLVSVGFTISVLIWLAAAPIASALGEPRAADLIRWTGAIVFLQSLGSIPAAVLKRQLDFRLFALRTMAGTAIGGLIGITLALSGHGVWSLVFMQLGKVAVEAVILLGFGSWRPRLRFSFARCRDLFGFAGPLVVQSLWNLVNDELPKVVLSLFVGTQAVGIYAFARRPLEFLIQGFLGPVTAIAMPAVSRLQAEPEKIDLFFAQAVRMAGFVGFPVFLGFAAVAPEAVPLIFGMHWVDAVAAVQILMVLGLARIVDSLSGLSLLALGHSRLLLMMNILYTGLCLLLLPPAARFGVEAVVAAVVLCNFLLLPVFLRLAQQIGGIDVLASLAVFPRLALSAAAMVAAVVFVRHSAPGESKQLFLLILEVTAGGLAFGATALLTMRSELQDSGTSLLRIRS